ncbi:hypothetical protein AMES_2282 [Amycolatopsis mediterranei S699]|uniref:Uncharacterized protein n=2 Tax=Amycolatopsis mediterranei TaxID=33910 RepID=A0A0H3D1B7_AMYMU|nr:hypothetical protein [Amycolatopsis mediterranei]ADJ44105.1 conserved hypothetical protein [Amycolatopsis mediterranei U32]AEK40840.1 hypothetical protein RAM_11750 [Amycolatopsis mediterranei S699]AFO75818.1 hypothetical protein AMES_2282 [Amycolatopsis mediterranei S699]AGT82947.1 hypothetical protein B737_2283 [Amycolatopsis mediterranei RB]KDO06464.1 hypothetical protein DV26_32775 [Amycolatopsis mediterranei]
MTQPAEDEPGNVVNSASVSGDVTGNIVQIGDVAGSFHYGARGIAKSWYRGTVREVAPDHLKGRETELAELERFCRESDPAPSYAWWRADAWSGKTALMASFVLDPPEEVRLVAFFISARDAESDNRTGFLAAVIPQLAEVLGIPEPEKACASDFPGLLDAAAEASAKGGRRLILVVDGLDEDRAAGGAGSIAALLPRRPAHGMRVIVSGRSSPGIPPVLHQHHPLRDAAIVRELAPSPAASAVRQDKERDLDRLLHAEAGEARDTLGLLVAARGGLSRDDLVELIGRGSALPAPDDGVASGIGGPDQVESRVRAILNSVGSRVFSRREARCNPGSAPEIYLLGHEGLQDEAVLRFGEEALQAYRDRITAWADGYRDQGWPVSTPQFLLLGYPRLLQDAGQLERLVECVTDLARQERLLEVSGGEASAQAEIAAAHAAVSASARPDVVSLVKLAVHRADLGARNARTPARLPALWARLGKFDRAEALARSISARERRIDAVCELAQALARVGQVDRAERIVAEVVDEKRYSYVRRRLISEVAACGDIARARAMAEAIENAGWRSRALLTLSTDGPESEPASMLAAADGIADGDARLSARFFVAGRLVERGEIDRAVELSNTFDPVFRAEVVERAARRLLREGDAKAAYDLAASEGAFTQRILARLELEDLARTDLQAASAKVSGVGDSNRREQLVYELIRIAIDAGRIDCAESLIGSTSSTYGRRGLSLVLESVAAREGYERAMELLRKKFGQPGVRVGPETRAAALTALAEGVLKFGDIDTAKNLASRAESAARRPGDDYRHNDTFRSIVDFVVAANDVPAAERLARILIASGVERHDFPQIARLLANSGDVNLAEQVVVRLDRASELAEAMATLLRRHRAAGAWEEVRRIADQVGERVAEIHSESFAATRLVDFYCAAGLPDQALGFAEKIEDSHDRRLAYSAVIGELCAVGRIERAIAIVRDSGNDEVFAFRLVEPLAEAMGAAGYGDGLDVLASLGVEPHAVAGAAFLERLAQRDLERALDLVSSSLRAYSRSSVLLAMARRLAEPARSRILAEVAQSSEWPSVLPALSPEEYPGVTEIVGQFIRLQEVRVGLGPEDG